VPPCMAHKLPSTHHGQYLEFDLHLDDNWSVAYAIVVSTRSASPRQMKQTGKYDLSIDGTKCYSVGGLSNGVIVHNSLETTSGGNALKFYSSVRMDIRRKTPIKDGDVHVGNEVLIKVVKNKVAPPFTTALTNLYFGAEGYPSGFDYASSTVVLAQKFDIVKTQGSWYTFGDIRLGNGANAAHAFVRDNEDIFKQLRAKVREACSGVPTTLPIVPDVGKVVPDVGAVIDSDVEDSDDVEDNIEEVDA